MNCGYPFNDRFSFWPGNVYTAYCLPCLHIQDMEYVCEHSFSPIYLVTGVNSPAFSSYLHQEEGHAVRLQGPGELHILHFCLDLRHLATVFMFLDRDHQSHLHPSITTYCMLCVALWDLHVFNSVNSFLNREQITIIPMGHPQFQTHYFLWMQHLSNVMYILGIFSSRTPSAWCTLLVGTPSGYRDKWHFYMVTLMSYRHFLFC